VQLTAQPSRSKGSRSSNRWDEGNAVFKGSEVSVCSCKGKRHYRANNIHTIYHNADNLKNSFSNNGNGISSGPEFSNLLMYICTSLVSCSESDHFKLGEPEQTPHNKCVCSNILCMYLVYGRFYIPSWKHCKLNLLVSVYLHLQ